tara:strand:- start:5 stop:466 length:462 start_codon:yes stop_codon:yes gene_type:complete
MLKINVISNNLGWNNLLSNPNTYIEKKVTNLNKKNKNFKKNIIYCTLLLSGDLEIKKLNKKFRNKNKSTDVLSFPFYNKKDFQKKLKIDKEIYLGDIIVNINKIKDKNLKNSRLEFNRLWIHGLVHLLGYDHKKKKDFYKMLEIEKKFLSYLK